MKETIQYLCEFFFCDGVHFLGLVIVCLALAPKIRSHKDK